MELVVISKETEGWLNVTLKTQKLKHYNGV